jgi:TonB family protein
MRKLGLLLALPALLALSAGAACAQQEIAPSSDDGPLHIKAMPPQPDKDGVYSIGPGIANPIVLERVAAVYPGGARPEEVNGFTLLNVVINADGTPGDIQVVHSHGAAFDDAAIEAVKQTKFEAGTLDGKPVPVRVVARIRFSDEQRPAYPRIVTEFGMRARTWQSAGGSGFASRQYDKPPTALYAPAAEYSEQARRAKFGGVVLLTVLVTEEGLPTDIKVTKSLGMGLDEKAVESVGRYRFKPAMKDGEPVAARIAVEVSFRLY